MHFLISRPLRLFRRLAILSFCHTFHKALDTRKKLHFKKSQYYLQDINDMTEQTDAPVEISIKIPRKKSINFHCGRTRPGTDREREKWNKVGWCATRLDDLGMFYNLNIFI